MVLSSIVILCVPQSYVCRSSVVSAICVFLRHVSHNIPSGLSNALSRVSIYNGIPSVKGDCMLDLSSAVRTLRRNPVRATGMSTSGVA